MTDSDPIDANNMQTALALARRGLGAVHPNPAVGCVLVRQDLNCRVVGRGWTQPGGRPHAESEACARAGALAAGATAYVTLEPCDHHGETPPCSEALISAGVTRCVVAMRDPDSRVAGKGIARLQAAGVDVLEGLCRDEAAALNAGYLSNRLNGRPLFTVKTATTLDGRIATHSGESHWITGDVARAFAHGLRANHDAIMVGSATALADDPMLTCRLPGLLGRSPVRIVSDTRMRLPLTSRLVETARQHPLWLVTIKGGDDARRQAYTDAGVEIIAAPDDGNGAPDLTWVARDLARRGLTRVLVEGGGHLTAALLRLDLVDRLVWFRAPRLMGGDGMPMSAAFGVDRLSDTVDFALSASRRVGDDLLETYERRR